MLDSRKRMLLSAVATLSFGLSPTLAAAQAADVPPEPSESEEVVVTGSRIARAGFSAPTPTTVVNAEELERTGASNVAQLLNTLPAFRATVSSSVRTFTMDSGANYMDLRGLGIARTLTLVNGQRHVPSNITGQVDLNLIPSILIDRIDVVTGGASAAYGSDAVAGVVNLLYKEDFEGLQGDVQGGVSRYGDNEEVNVSLLYGAAFADGRGHLTLAGQFVDNEGGSGYDTREWGRTNYLLWANPNYTPGGTEPTRLFVGGVSQSNTTLGGVINAPGVLRGIQFADDGAPIPFIYGNPVGPQNMVGGTGTVLAPYQLTKAPLSRAAVNARVTYDITPSIEFAGEFSASYAEVADGRGGTAQRQLTIQRDNAFLPESIRDVMTANSITSFTLGRQISDVSLDPERPWYIVNNEATVYRGVLSLAGSFESGWSWDAYYEHGQTSHDEFLVGNLIVPNFLRAIDAVVNPANGATVCRSTLSPDAAVRAAAAGCVPYDVFGNFARSDEAARYASGNTVNNVDLSEDAASISAQGNPFSTWAGPISVAFGMEYRRDSVSTETDAISQADGFNNYNPKPISGDYIVSEGFVETVIPLAEGAPFARSLEFNGGVRIADYNYGGSVTSWKAGLSYRPLEDVRLRFTRSRDVRAPNMNELFSTTATLTQAVIDPELNTNVTVQIITGGNQALTPEFANTTTLGIVLEPSWAPGLRASVDAYDIEIEDVISTLNPQDAINRCFAGEIERCASVQRNSAGGLTRVSQQFQNFASLQTRGVDFELLYQLPIEDLFESMPGDLTFRLLTTYVDKLETSDGLTAIDVAGETSGLRVGGVPHWTGRGIIAYDNDRLSLSTTLRYVGNGKQDALGTPQNINDNTVPSRTYMQLAGSYTFIERDDGRRLQFFGVIDNVFDSDPPPTAGTSWIQTNSALFDLNGRSYTLGVRFKY
ncbi:MAG: TonB-dependent receptor [Terricaulis sp.]